MKRLLPILLMALLVGACGGATPATESPATESPVAEVTPSPVPTPDCTVAPLPCVQTRVIILPYPGSIDDNSAAIGAALFVFEDGTGLSYVTDTDTWEHTRLRWAWTRETVAPLFAAFDSAPAFAAVPLGSVIQWQDIRDSYVKGRIENPEIIAAGDGTDQELFVPLSTYTYPIDSLLDSVILAGTSYAYDKKTGEVIVGQGGVMPSVDPDTVFAVNADRSGTIVRNATMVVDAAKTLLSSGTSTEVLVEDCTGDMCEEKLYAGILPDWLDPESGWWEYLFVYIGI